MKLKQILPIGCLAAATLAFALPSSAAMAQQRVKTNQTATEIFQDIQADSWQVQNHAGFLQNYQFNPTVDKFAAQDQLSAIRAYVNDMGTKIYQLEKMRWNVAPWQRAEINRIATPVQLMADNTEDAILFVNNHPEDLRAPRYQKYADNIYSESQQLHQSTATAVAFANASKEYSTLGREMTKAS